MGRKKQNQTLAQSWFYFCYHGNFQIVFCWTAPPWIGQSIIRGPLYVTQLDFWNTSGQKFWTISHIFYIYLFNYLFILAGWLRTGKQTKLTMFSQCMLCELWKDGLPLPEVVNEINIILLGNGKEILKLGISALILWMERLRFALGHPAGFWQALKIGSKTH